jgi:Ca2+-binding EF-hand superfamily protein
MCSIETEKRLSKLLMILAEGERTVEISRKVLSELKEYEPFTIFRNLDGERKNKIDSFNIINYLENKGIYVSEQEAQLIILFYDQDFDCFLSFSEFINLIQSESNINSSNKIYNKNEIPFNVDYSFVKLLEKEVELARKFLYALKDLKCRYDFNIHNIYHSIKSYSTITPDSIRSFFTKNEIQFLDSDIKFIIKRLDLNKDGKIDLCEFHSLLGFPECSFCCPCMSCSSCDFCYCNSCFPDNSCHFHGQPINNEPSNKAYKRKEENNINNNNNNQKNRILKSRNDSPLRDNDNNNYYNKNKVSNSLFIRDSPQKKNYDDINLSSPNDQNENVENVRKIKNYSKGLNNYEINQFNNFLKLLMDTEREIEEKKVDLSLKQDFNCEDAFRIFEKNGRGFLTKEDMKYGLYLLGVNYNDFIINLLFKRFNFEYKNEINYADFFDMLIPFEKEYRNDIEERIPYSNSFQCIEVFSEKTIKCLRNVLNTIINSEIKINEMRKRLSGLMRKLKDIFRMFDTKGLGFFEFEDYINYLKKNQLLDESLNIDLLFIRLDKNRNGKIYFSELADEFEALY